MAAASKTYDENQKMAMLDESEACLVKANVGSGKTAVLTGKVRYLHGAKMVEYPDMAVLTFTNRAADEIRLRLQIADEMRSFGTFHSVALNLLRKELPVETLGYTRDFQVITPEEELEMAEILIVEHGLKVKYKNRLKKRLEKYRKGGEKPGAKADDLGTLADLLATEKVKQDKMSFTDLLENAVALLREKHFKGYRWILVDEVQDCDALQLEFIDVLMQLRPNGERPKFFAVGDPGQVIYSWRGSTLNVFYVLKERYHAIELALTGNYRSASGILDVASKFRMSGTEIVPTRDAGKKVVIREHYDPLAEAEYLSDRIREAHDAAGEGKAGEGADHASVSWRQFAVFYRLQSQAEILEKVFIRNGIPCDVSGRREDEISPAVRWVLRVLRASVCPKDTVAKRMALGDELANPMPDVLEGQIDGLESAKGVADADALYDWFDFSAHLHPTAESFEKDSAAVRELLSQVMKDFNPEEEVLSAHIKDYLDKAALGGLSYRQDDHVDRRDAVRLMTLHASKGLEFKYVYIIGLNDGLLPLSSGDELDEEMRLFYVGITRAKDELELSYYTNPGFHGAREGMGRFLKMIPDKLVDKPDAKDKPAVSLHELRRMIEQSRKAGAASPQPENSQEEILTADTPMADLLTAASPTAEAAAKTAVTEAPATETPTANTPAAETAAPETAAPEAPAAETAAPEAPAAEIPAQPARKVTHPHYGEGTILEDDGVSVTVHFEGYGDKSFVKAFSDWLQDTE